MYYDDGVVYMECIMMMVVCTWNRSEFSILRSLITYSKLTQNLYMQVKMQLPPHKGIAG